MTDRWPLTKPGSEKETHHIILDLNGSGITYTPGDSLGVFAQNSPELVDELISQLGFPPETTVTNRSGEPVTFRHVLLHDYILNRAAKKILNGLIERLPPGTQRNQLSKLILDQEAVAHYTFSRDYVDILREFNTAQFTSPEDFLSLLYPVVPRLYSIASSLKRHPNEVHLCVAIVRYTTHGRAKKGLCSGFFADHVQPGSDRIPIYVQAAHNFHLPPDPARDIIMCGPGTGVAPFRAFLEQRILDNAPGRNWLLFGEQHQATDFYYEDEFTSWHKQGILHRLDLAFSRDQAQKIYVQHRLREHGREVWDWLQNGAYFYVCGDAKRMAKDVHVELINIARTHGSLSETAAADYVENTLTRTERRYLRDVY